MSESLSKFLLRLAEVADPAVLWGRQAKPYLGRAFDRLLAGGVLVEQAPATAWPVCAACDCGLDMRPIEKIDGRPIASCPNDTGSDVVLDADDLRSFHIDSGRLTQEIALASGFEVEPEEVAPGVWWLGPTPTGRVAFLAYTIAATRQPGLLAVLRAAARGAPVTLLGPKLPPDDWKRMEEAGVHHVLLREAIGSDEGFPLALEIPRLVSDSVVAPRLVIVASTRQVTLDGVEGTLSEQPFRLLYLMAERARSTPGVPVSTRVIDEHIWGSSIHRVARPARDVVRELRAGLAEGGPDRRRIRGLIENRHNRGYLLALPPEEIDIRP